MNKKIEDIIKDRILILDGAMGTMIQKHKLEEEDFRGERFRDHPSLLKGNNDLLTITRPEIIKSIHTEYLQAGADIITTNTFNSNRISMADYHMEDLVYELNVSAAKLAKEAVNDFERLSGTNSHFVTGTLGPTNKTASMSSDVSDPGARSVTFDDLVSAYSEQTRGLIDGGSDLLLVETIFDVLNCKAALFAIDSVFEEKGDQASRYGFRYNYRCQRPDPDRSDAWGHSSFQYRISPFSVSGLTVPLVQNSYGRSLRSSLQKAAFMSRFTLMPDFRISSVNMISLPHS